MTPPLSAEDRARRARRWRFVFVLAILLCGGLLVANLLLAELRPDNAWGLGYGIAAAVLLLAVALFGGRRRTMRAASRWRLGSSSAWLRFHLYGGALFLLLMLLHSGFGLPNGALTVWLWGLSLWTSLSGAVGLSLQRWIPRMLASGLSIEVLYERIPELVDEIRQRAERLVESASEPIRALYAREVAPALAAPRNRWIYFLDVTGGVRSRLLEFDHLRELLGAEERNKLHELQRLFETKLEIDAHYTLQRPLRWWLYLHVPTSLILVLLVALHVFTVLYY